MGNHVLSKQNGQFRRLIDDLATADTLTVVIGAGASMDAGLPAWRNLVKTFLENGFKSAKTRGWVEGAYDKLAEHVLNTQDLLPAATIGRYLHGDRRDEQIKSALYEELERRPPPCRVYCALAALALIYGEDLLIVTTNYDDLLETALEGSIPLRIDGINKDGLVTIRDDGPGSVRIVHLHGYAPYEGEIEGCLVLDEEDYALSKARPPGEILPSLLDHERLTLFVGLSMTDPNLVTACHLLPKDDHLLPNDRKPRWYGLFVSTESETLHGETIAFLHQRLSGMGIKSVDLASYGQVSQVLFEATFRQAHHDDYWTDSSLHRYGLRMERWRNKIEEKYGGATGGDAFQATHNLLHDGLTGLLAKLLDEELADRKTNEHFGLHLWVRNPEADGLGKLELWASSAHLHREAWSLAVRSIEIQPNTGIMAVECVYHASTHKRNKSDSEFDRWQAVVAVPIDLADGADFGNLVVGCVTLSSTNVMSQSALRANYSAASDRLRNAGRQLLTPDNH